MAVEQAAAARAAKEAAAAAAKTAAAEKAAAEAKEAEARAKAAQVLQAGTRGMAVRHSKDAKGKVGSVMDKMGGVQRGRLRNAQDDNRLVTTGGQTPGDWLR